MKFYKIGITIKDSSKIWSNGLTQNAYNLIILLKRLGHEVDAISESKDEDNKFIEEFKIKKIEESNISFFDIIIEVCYSLSDYLYDKFTTNGGKVVSINYGNLLMLMQEDLILDSKNIPALNRYKSTTWISPHFEFSKGFIEVLTKSNVETCPYIWSNILFDKYCKSNNLNPFDKKDLSKINIGILEPNINIIKTAIYPIISAEILERSDKTILNSLMIFNSDILKTNKKFKEIIENFDLLKNKKLSVEGRIHIANLFAKKYINMIISHQFNCELNYLFLDALYCRSPIIHNSKTLSDYGFYYEEFDAKKCASLILEAKDEYGSNYNKYIDSSNECINKYSIDNSNNIRGYQKLIESL